MGKRNDQGSSIMGSGGGVFNHGLSIEGSVKRFRKQAKASMLYKAQGSVRLLLRGK